MSRNSQGNILHTCDVMKVLSVGDVVNFNERNLWLWDNVTHDVICNWCVGKQVETSSLSAKKVVILDTGHYLTPIRRT